MNEKQTIRDVMTRNPRIVDQDASVAEVASLMREADFGSVIVSKPDGSLCGIVTDRDIVIRSVATNQDLQKTKISEICSKDPVCLSPTDTIDEAVRTMVKQSVRRIPVVENQRPVGIVSLGDLAIERQPNSALGSISAAPAQN